ncbi:MAG: DUF2273 domain-containing protein [Clostridia bacterium]|nr:DUF2273 domain-containing protein [Clostridia bacterium]
MNKEKLLEFYNLHRGGINGALVGFAAATVILLIGIFKTLFLAICIGTGYYVGKRLSEDKDYIKNLLDRVLPPGSYR